MSSPWPLQVVALKPVACGTALWRVQGALRVTVFIKATFGLVHDSSARLIAPVELARHDQHRDNNPLASLEQASDIAPYLPKAGVVLTGHAYAPQGRPVPAMSARLALFREQRVFDNTLHIFGDRTTAAPNNPAPFQKMPIVYERAFGGPGVEENPVGVGAAPDAKVLPNIVDPANPRRPAGLGPISRYWPSRKRLLGATDRKSLEATVAEIPSGFDWSFFQPAPVDQQVDYLSGDEWIVLDGLHPALPRLQTRLPQVRGQARWHLVTKAGAGPARPIELVADTLTIDADRQRCSIVWRGNFALDHISLLLRARVYAGIEMPGYAITWPDPKDIPMPSPEDEQRVAAVLGPALGGVQQTQDDPDPGAHGDPLLRTTTLTPQEMAARTRKPIAPFALATPGSKPQTSGTVIPGAPWSPGAPAPAPPRAPQPDESTRVISIPQPAEPLGSTGEFDVRQAMAAILPFAPATPGQPAPQPAPARPPEKRSTGGFTTSLSMPVSPGAALPFVSAEPPKPGAVASAPAEMSPGGQAWPAPGQPATATGAPALVPPPMQSPPAMVPPPPMQGLPAMVPPPPMQGLPAMVPPPPMQGLPAMVPPPPMQSPPAMVPPPPMQGPPAMVPPAPLNAEPPASVGATPSERRRLFPPVLGAPSPTDAPSPSSRIPDAAPVSTPEPPVSVGALASPGRPPMMSVAPPPLVGAETPAGGPSSTGPGAFDASQSAGAAGEVSGLRATVTARLRAHESMQDLQLANADLREVNFSGAALSRINLKGANLQHCSFAGARMSEAQLAGADLTGADLTGADLTQADLTRAVVARARFDRATLTEANFSSARGPEASFAGATGRRPVFARGVWDGASLRGVDWMSADFSGASLEKADVQDASLIEVRLDDVRGSGAVFDGSKLPQARASGATFTGGSFVNIDAPGSAWERATLNDASFRGANLKGASFLRASCAKACFAGVEAAGANLQRLTADGADFSGAKLEAADLRQARLQEATFDEATLRKVVANKADLTRCRFTRADLTSAVLRAAKLKEANLSYAKLDEADLRDTDLERSNMQGATKQTAKMSGANTKDMIERDPGDRG